MEGEDTKKGGGVCVRVSGRGATDVWKEKTHNIRGGGCVRVSGRDGTDRCVRDTQNKKGGGVWNVYMSEVAVGLMCGGRGHKKKGGGVCTCQWSQWD